MQVETIVTGMAMENCYLVYGKKELLIIDPGADAPKIIAAITATKKLPIAILLIHAHFDHIGALDELRDLYQIPVYGSELEKDWFTDPKLNLSEFTGHPFTTKLPDTYFLEQTFELGEFTFKVVATPGHSVGSVSFLFDTFAIVGDTLFRESIGRTDFPTGDTTILLKSIAKHLLTLPDDLPIYPGHGQPTTANYERDNNSYLGGN